MKFILISDLELLLEFNTTLLAVILLEFKNLEVRMPFMKHPMEPRCSQWLLVFLHFIFYHSVSLPTTKLRRRCHFSIHQEKMISRTLVEPKCVDWLGITYSDQPKEMFFSFQKWRNASGRLYGSNSMGSSRWLLQITPEFQLNSLIVLGLMGNINSTNYISCIMH